MNKFIPLYESILASSIWMEDSPTRLVWITMLLMADENGFVNSSIPGLARYAAVPTDECQKAIDRFLSPDTHSRNNQNEGRRIAEMDGGWWIINYQNYRSIQRMDDKREDTRLRVRRHREAKKISNPDLISKQNGLCGCCGDLLEKPYNKYSALDHDHKTGKTRSIVCVSCNSIIGRIENGKSCISKKRSAAESYIAKYSK